MAGDSPLPTSRKKKYLSSGLAPKTADSNIRSLLIVGCIVLIYLLLGGSDNDQYDDDSVASPGLPGRIQAGPAPAPGVTHGRGRGRDHEGRGLGTKLQLKFRNLLSRVEFAGYGPNHPRVAVVVVGDPDTVVGAVESVFRNTDRNRILVVVAVMDGHHEDPDLTAALRNVNSGNDVGHWHGTTFHDHDEGDEDKDGKDNQGGKGGSSKDSNDHGGQKVYVFYNPDTEPQGMSASRSDAVDFVNILIKKHEEAGLKRPDEEILLLFLRSDGRIVNERWLDLVTNALVMPPESETGNLANAVSFHVDSPNSKPGDTVTIGRSLHIEPGTASASDLGEGRGMSYPTPIAGSVATAMRLHTYNALPASDVVLTTSAAADVELSFNLWLCGDGIDVLTQAIVRVDRNNPHHSSDDMTDEEAARIVAAWISKGPDDKGAIDQASATICEARAWRYGGNSNPKEARRLEAMVDAEKQSRSLPRGLGRKCKPFNYFEDMFHVGIAGMKADTAKEAPTLHPQPKNGDAGEGRLVERADDSSKRLPSNPLDSARLKIIQGIKPVKINYVDASGGHKEHPHMGAKDEDGNFGYIHDEAFLHRHPPKFELPDAEAACSKRDANHRMLTEKVFIDVKADAAAEKRSKETGKPRPKIMCVIFTIEKYHGKLSAISHTWGPKCDGIVYASDKTDRVIGTVNIPHEGKEEYKNIWQKNRSIWAYVYDNYYDKYDYFHSGGDDVYILVENLRLYLESEEIQTASNGGIYLPNGDEEYQVPLFLGRRFAENGDMSQIFNSGGSGYTLNKAALKTLVVDAMPSCMPHLHTFSEDVQVARCLRKLGVPAYDTKDEKGAERYMPFQPGHHLTYRPPPRVESDWYALDCIDCKWGFDHCSDHSIAFHYIKSPLMDRMHALLYGYCEAKR